MTKKLDNALGLYLEGIRDGDVRAAITKYTGARYTQHSTGVGDGEEGFVAFFEDFLQRNPVRDIRILRSFEDGPYVFCHASQDLNEGASRWVTMDLFETDEQDKVVEHWDVISAWLPDAADGRSQIAGGTEVRDLERTDANKARVREFVDRVLVGGALVEAAAHLAPDLIQHELAIAGGAHAWIAHLFSQQASGRAVAYQEIFRLIGQGNFVVTYCKVNVAGQPHAVFDLFRVHEDRIAERWTSSEVVPDDTGNSGKF